MDTTTPDMTAAAFAWHQAGCCVIRAATDGSKAPLGGWKQYQTTRPTPAVLRAWFGHGHPGLGLVTGAVSDHLEMLELEGRAMAEGVGEQLAAVIRAAGLTEVWVRLTAGYVEQSPSGGLHILYRTDQARPNTKLARRPATDDELTLDPADRVKVLVETRGEGGFVVTAPSHGTVHTSGKPWATLAGTPQTIPVITTEERDALHDAARALDQMPPPPVPLVQERGAQAHAAGGTAPGADYNDRTTWDEILTPLGWTEVHRRGDETLWRRPGKRLGISASTGYRGSQNLYVWSTSTDFTAEVPYTRFGAYTLLHHSGDYSAAARALRTAGYGQPAPEPARPRRHLTAVPATDGTAALQVAEPEPGPDTYSYTDDGNALRLIDTHTDDIRYVPEAGRWYMWDGQRWAPDIPERTRELAKTIARTLPADTPEQRRHRAYSLSARGTTAFLRQAQSDPRITTSINQLDAHPLTLNTPDGSIDLTTGTLTPHQRSAFHTKITATTPNPHTPTPRWSDFLATTFGNDPDLIAFVQRIAGYSASGDVRHHVLPFLFGAGQNGKSVLVDVLKTLLGDYADSAPAGFLIAGKQEHSEEIARLHGKRLVVASETNREAKFDESKIKELTGGDSITARFMRQSFFTFRPTHHLWLMANHQPRVKAGGDSFWRRLRIVPFPHKVPDDKKIDNLSDILTGEEGPGIMAWIVAGAVDVFAKGLREPASVMAATNAYAAEEDHLGRFLDERCHRGGGDAVKLETKAFREAYERWCHEEGENPLDSRSLGRELKPRGIERKPSNGRYFYTGLALIQDGDHWGDR